MNVYTHSFFLKQNELIRLVDIPKRLHYSDSNAFCFALRKSSSSPIEYDDKALYNPKNDIYGITIHMFYTNDPAEQDFVKRLPKPLLPYYYALEIRKELTTQYFMNYNVFDIYGRRVYVDYDNGPDYSSIGCDNDGE